MRTRLLRNWHPMRYLQLGMGLLFLAQGITRHEALAATVGIFFGIQAVLNIGCCGIQGRARATAPVGPGKDHPIEYEEIQ